MPIVSSADVIVNRSKSGSQSDIVVAALPDGGWTTTWRSEGIMGSSASLYQQVFRADGSLRGTENRINSSTIRSNFDQTIDILTGGGWVVTWVAENATVNGSDIHQRVFNVDGMARDQDTIVSGYGFESNEKQIAPHVSVLERGGQVITWQRLDTGYSENWQIRNLWDGKYQVTDGAGLNTVRDGGVGFYNKGHRYDVETIALKNGGFIAIWVAEGRGNSFSNQYDASYGSDIFQKFYSANGTEQTLFLPGDIPVNEHVTGNQFNPATALLSNGGWVVSWISKDQDGSGAGVYQRAYNSAGVTVQAETRVNSFIAGDQHHQTVTQLADGGWVVTWISEGQDGSGAGIYQKSYTARGTASISETRVNTDTLGDQQHQKVAALSDGGWVVVWSSPNKSGAGTDIHQQVYKPNGAKFGGQTVIRANGASSNDHAEVTALKGGGWVVAWEALDNDGMGGVDLNVHQKIFSNSSAPRITSGNGAIAAMIQIAENKTNVSTLRASDAENQSLSWSLIGGEDKSLFSINAKTGTLSFNSKPDHEAPTDYNKDNVYKIIVKVTDPDRFGDTQALSIAVKDVKGKAQTGDGRANILIGSIENDTIKGGAGGDLISGKEDNDLLFGETGNDDISGDAGNDTLYGGSDHDRLSGNDGDDQIYGGSENDQLDGGRGHDRLYGETGNDIILGGNGNDQLDGGKGVDALDGGAGNDILYGQAGVDVLVGLSGDDRLYGGSDRDVLTGGRGADALYGGSGSDLFILDTPLSSRGTKGEIDTIFDFERGKDKIDLSSIDWVSDTDNLNFQLISIYAPSPNGVTVTSGWRVTYDGIALVEVVSKILSDSDFLI